MNAFFASWVLVTWVCNTDATRCVAMPPQIMPSYERCEASLPVVQSFPPPSPNMQVIASCVNPN
jgi:hypothetical protein